MVRAFLVLTAAVLGAIGVGVAALSGSGPAAPSAGRPSGLPVFALAPRTAPAVHWVSGIAGSVCTIVAPARSGAPGSVALGLDPSPVGVVAVWLPGLNGPCVSSITTGGTPLARELADQVAASPPLGPRRVVICPMDDGSQVRLYFTYAGQRLAEQVDLAVTGCGYLSDPGRAGRVTTAALRHDLASIAPASWRTHLVG